MPPSHSYQFSNLTPPPLPSPNLIPHSSGLEMGEGIISIEVVNAMIEIHSVYSWRKWHNFFGGRGVRVKTGLSGKADLVLHGLKDEEGLVRWAFQAYSRAHTEHKMAWCIQQNTFPILMEYKIHSTTVG